MDIDNISYNNKKVISWNTITFIFSVFLNFIIYSILYKSFDPTVFGVYLTAISIYLFGNSLDLGISISIIKVISQKRLSNSKEYIDKFLSTFFFITIMMGLFIMVIILISYWFLFRDMIAQFDLSNYFLVFLAFNFFCSFMSGFLRVIYEGFYEYIVLAKLSIFITLLNLIAALSIYFFSFSIIYLALFNVIVSITNFSLLLTILYRKKLLKISLKLFSLQIFKDNIKYNLNIQISYIIGNSLEFIIRYLVGSMLSYNYVTYYENAKKIANTANGALAASQRNLLNKISEFVEKSDLVNYLNSNFQIYPRISLAFSVLTYGVLSPAIILFILYWFKSFETVILYSILIFPYTIINYASPLYNVLLINKDGKYLIIIQTINIILTTSFLYFYLTFLGSEIGIVGYNLAIFISLILIMYFLKIVFKINVKEFFKNIYGYHLLFFLLCLCVQAFIIIYYNNYLIPSIIFSIIYLTVFYKEIKFFISNVLKMRL